MIGPPPAPVMAGDPSQAVQNGDLKVEPNHEIQRSGYESVVDHEAMKNLAEAAKRIALDKLQTEEINSRYEDRRAIFAAAAASVIANDSAARLTRETVLLDDRGRQELLSDVIDWSMGLGELNEVLKIQNASDILLNGATNTIIHFRDGVRERRAPLFSDVDTMRRWVRALGRAFGSGAAFDRSTPEFDVRLPGGVRLNAGMCVNYGVTVSLRVPNRSLRSLASLHHNGTLDKEMFRFLQAVVRARLNCLIAGGTGAGKTSLMICMLVEAADLERIATIEDRVEMELQHYNPNLDVIELEAVPPNTDGVGEVTTRDLLRGALRKHPDRIIVGEVRDEIAREMFQAMVTGNEGSMATLHARDPESVVDRLTDCARLEPGVVRSAIRNALDIIVHISLDEASGNRRITAIKQVDAMPDPDMLHFHNIFIGDGVHHPNRVGTPTGRVLQRMAAVGWQP